MLKVDHLITAVFPASPIIRQETKTLKGVNDKKIKSFCGHLLVTYFVQAHSRIESGQVPGAHTWVQQWLTLCLYDSESVWLPKCQSYPPVCLTLVPALPAVSWLLHLFSQSTITNDHRLGGLQHKLLAHRFESQKFKIKVLKDLNPSKDFRGQSPLASSFWWLWLFILVWLPYSNLYLYLHRIIPFFSVGLSSSVPYKNICHQIQGSLR